MGETGAAYEKLGFLALNMTDAGDGYIGAILVTNADGIPLEFRATHPVKPTAIQRTLYGETLEPYVGVILCGQQLLKSSEQQPHLLFVNREMLLALREDTRMPVIFCRQAGQTMDVSRGGEERLPSARLESLGSSLTPIVITVHGTDAGILEGLREKVEKLALKLDVMEPFKRIAEALKVLSKQDRRFQ